ncbi:protein translocase subunit yidC [Tepidimonas ignava]|uniref:Membrane protein insertase YidC n=1 Tax=Tepidimonas ignava TaxID=114249 RepID=A0A4R3L932_9BURK|nr:membrane protein insertase YidC [Tepidimonas ignava]TCS94006.1 protein translocase subunit yidC [Tepidimonas ignava]TSE18746.1 Membrane protein insertase YidC [Tepidimonas ignava]
MNDIRRSILWVIFGFSLILLWDRWQVHHGQPATFFPAGTPRPAATAPTEPSKDVPQPSVAATATPPGGAAAPAPSVPRQRHTVRTDVLELTLDSVGGTVVEAKLLKHATETGKALRQGFTPLTLLVDDGQRTYVAQSGLVAEGRAAPTHKTPMRLVEPAAAAGAPLALADGQDALTLVFESEPVDGVVLRKRYTFKRGSYAIAVQHEVVNQGDAPVHVRPYQQLLRDGLKAGSETPFYSTFTGPAVYSSAAKYQKVEFAHIDKGNIDIQRQADDGYVAMVQHYFFSAWLLPQGTPRENYVRKVDNLYAVGQIGPALALAPGAASATAAATLYVGPQEEKVLREVAPGLELVKDYGWLTIIAKPLYWLLEKIHTLVGNWGWAIVLLVVLIKAAFYWLNASAYRSMAKMKAINPRIMEMRERLKDKPQLLQQEMMRLYREEKVNPLGGCLPILIQIPVFIALYWVLLASVEMRNAPWVGWIEDLSSPDPYYVLPLIMALTTVVQTALNPLPPDPLQAKMMWLMPLVFSVMFFFFPAGLVLYWIVNNVLTIAQQAYINHTMGVPLKFNLPNFK